MNVKEIKEIASAKGIKAGKMKKREIVRAIQEAEGNNPCFEADFSPECKVMDCLWRSDCIKV